MDGGKIDEEMKIVDEENSPLRHNDGLKQPRVQPSVLGVSQIEDSSKALGILVQPNQTRSTGLGKEASRA